MTAHACHESTGANSVQTTSILRMNRFRETISPSQCVAIHTQCCGFSTDQEEKANSGYLPATCQLVDTSILRPLVNIKNDSRFALFMSLAILCMISNSQSDNDSVNIANNKVYRGHSECYRSMRFHLRGKISAARREQARYVFSPSMTTLIFCMSP